MNGHLSKNDRPAKLVKMEKTDVTIKEFKIILGHSRVLFSKLE
jgi:hypothetical protein